MHRQLAVRDAVRDDGAVYAGPFASRRRRDRGGRGAARQLSAANLPAARARRRGELPARRRGQVPRALPRRRRGARLHPLGALAGGLAGRRGGRARRPAAGARRPPGPPAALRGCAQDDAADRRAALGRRPGRGDPARRHGAPGCCSPPTSIRATSSRSPSCAERSSPSAACRAPAIPGSSSPPSRASSSARSLPLPGLAPSAEGPWLPAERYAEALLLTHAFAGRARGVVPIPCTAPDALVLKRIEGARRRVPVREPLPPGRHPRPDDLLAVA